MIKSLMVKSFCYVYKNINNKNNNNNNKKKKKIQTFFKFVTDTNKLGYTDF